MTESEWLSSPNGALLFDQLARSCRARRANLDRKILLYVAAALRQEGSRLPGSWRDLPGVLASFADGRASRGELLAAVPAEELAPGSSFLVNALVALGRHAMPIDLSGIANVHRMLYEPGEARQPLWWRAELLREVFGNPFRISSSPFHPAPLPAEVAGWNGGAVPALARTIYEGEDFALLPVLADALEEAGGGMEAVLAHLRSPGPHVRGCWALDRVLGLS